MSPVRGGRGGANTSTGLRFEERTDFVNKIEQMPNYSTSDSIRSSNYGIYIHSSKSKNDSIGSEIKINFAPGTGKDIIYNNEIVAKYFMKNEFYDFLKKNNIDWKSIISAKLIPDQSLLVIDQRTLFIVEIKFQKVAGSVDEKLQSCDFKNKQYKKLIKSIDMNLQYVYILNDWYKQKRYEDVLNYIRSVGCYYFFNELPLKWLGLPTD